MISLDMLRATRFNRFFLFASVILLALVKRVEAQNPVTTNQLKNKMQLHRKPGGQFTVGCWLKWSANYKGRMQR